MRRIALFVSLFFSALVAGGAFVLWIEYNPSGLRASFYAEMMQHAIRIYTVPLPVIVILSVVFTVLSAALARRERQTFYLLLAASACAIAVALITAFGNIPINNQIKTWDAASPPGNWADFAGQWWRFQTVRGAAALLGLGCAIVAAMRAAPDAAARRNKDRSSELTP